MSTAAAALIRAAPRDDLRGARLALAWAAYVGLTAFLLAIYLPGLPAFIGSFQKNPVSAVAIRDGLPWDPMWVWLVVLRLLDTGIHATAAGILLWLRPRNGFALVTSFALLSAGLGHSANQPATNDPIQVAFVLGVNAGILLLAFIFPDGRFVPRWGLWWWLVVLAGTHVLAFALVPVSLAVSIRSNGIVLILVGSVLAQIQRFRHHSTALQRAQAKWFFFGYLTFTSVFQLNLALRNLFPDLFGPTVATELRLAFVLVSNTLLPIAASVVPVAVLIAVLRWRLFTIDLIINRTLVYGALTTLLVALFALLSAALQRLLAGVVGGSSDIATVATALIVIGAFLPLRRALQSLVDRFIPERALLALLFTDLVSSTERVLALGDERWRELLDRYRSVVRRELARFEGREVDNAGDGFFAAFRTPAQAIACASAMRETVTGLGLQSRTGVHVGECEIRGAKVSGINVYTAARIMAAAMPDEILVSSTTRDLVAGSRLRFADRGARQLKGLPDEWQLYGLVGAQS